ncbi:uncharacterized protein B0I36DRAFT_314688 [Microdochium trichocladiopsis]|uniref:Conserved oligomeric Golgi complex subunit 1 n=1 Tax=Microdochium trichocladiopsis TaxID=1682393 RepID=A0A9P9BSB0_9PEZI|nr:uncharacterized protein B0I36DRAFT_314688 [Microdochium trichocladiopsis]KAH7037720.1 hypothetical protein B0I36DRAFT_314688 [Microdochium trichocladiopsis]
MAAAAPDTSTLTSSEQVFTSHTLPQIRAIHKALHVQIDDKSARLRTQVGNSYRELLGTADTIVAMRHEMRDAQEILGGMGAVCGRAVIGGKVKSVSRFRERRDQASELGVVARCRLLEACGLTVNRLMKRTGGAGDNNTVLAEASAGGRTGTRGGRLVLAAKVLVLGRLLVSSFGSGHDDTTRADVKEAIEAAKKSLASLRRRLLKSIDRLLEKVGTPTSRAEILNAMCAYSLASSSGARDVMFHFLNVRAKVLAFEFNLDEHDAHKGSENVLRGLDLYTGTLLDVQALIPNKLSEALAALKRNPLLSDDSLKLLETLRLDIYERWCGDDIHHFTPFIQHNDLEGSQAREMLHAWAGKGGETLLSGTKDTLEHTSEFKGIIDLRTRVLQHWIKNGGKAKGFDPSVVLGGLRKVINERLLALLDTKVSKLRLVGSEVSATLESWKTGQTDRQLELWGSDLLDIDASENASHLTQAVISRLHGRNEAVSRAVTSYQSWFQLIDDVGGLVEHLKKQRWDNDVEEIEDEEVIEQRQKMLSKDDPEQLHQQLDSSLSEGFRALDAHLSSLWRAQSDGESSGFVAMYLLRILRDIRASLPELDALKDFGLANIPELHDKLAGCVAGSSIEAFAAATLPKRKVVGRALWEGSPHAALPVNPSPGIFRLLRDLMKSMGDAGLDLWTPAAVRALKRTFAQRLVVVWREELASAAKTNGVEEWAHGQDSSVATATQDGEGPDKEPPNDPEDTSASAEASLTEAAAPGDAAAASPQTTENGLSEELLIQWVYDIKYLEQCLRVDGAGSAGGGGLAELADEVAGRAGLDNEAQNKLSKASAEYWKRSSLLFGLLA